MKLYPKREEVLTAGIFYKYIIDPIEEAIDNNVPQTIKPVNLGNATDYGFELVGLKYFGNFGISANYTYTYTHIASLKVYYPNPSTITSILEDRPMQGQAPHIVN